MYNLGYEYRYVIWFGYLNKTSEMLPERNYCLQQK